MGREVRVEDVLGRAAIEVDFARVARYLNGRAVLVTGAGGSIGRELCRQVSATGARRLVPIPCGDIRVDLIAANRLQWFAEARQRFRGPVQRGGGEGCIFCRSGCARSTAAFMAAAVPA